jgi:hypothetical protein
LDAGDVKPRQDDLADGGFISKGTIGTIVFNKLTRRHADRARDTAPLDCLSSSLITATFSSTGSRVGRVTFRTLELLVVRGLYYAGA